MSHFIQNFKKYALLFSSLLLLAGCSRPQDLNAKLTITIPSKQQLVGQSKVGALSNYYDSKKICLGVNVSAADIKSEQISCGVNLGVSVGYVEAGGSQSQVELFVPPGKDRSVQIYAYLIDPAQSCPDVKSQVNPTKLYLVSEASGVEIKGPAATVEMTIAWPLEANHVASQLSLPGSCSSASSYQVVESRLSGGWKENDLGSGFKVQSRLSDVPSSTTDL